MLNFIKTLKDEKGGFKLDKPWRLDENSLNVIIPILRTKNNDRDYLLFSEATKTVSTDSGSINFVNVENNEDAPVLLCRGEIFSGKTQERAVIHDTLIAPNTTIKVAVRCIHMSKGIQGSTKMSYGGRVSSNINLKDQTSTWNTVQEEVSCYFNVGDSTDNSVKGSIREEKNFSRRVQPGQTSYDPFNSPAILNIGTQGIEGVSEMPDIKMDDYVSALKDMKTELKDMLKKMPYIEDQVGVVFFNENKFKGLELFNSNLSWKAVKDDTIAKEGASFVKNKNDELMFTYKPKAARKMVKKILGKDFKENVIFQDKNVKVIEIKSKKILGEGIIYKGKVLHLSLWSIAED